MKEVKISKDKSISPGKKAELKEKPGGSNVGKYKEVKSSQMAGKAGGAPEGSYPINTRKRAKAALAYAHNAPNPSGVKAAVHKKYPSLGKPKTSK